MAISASTNKVFISDENLDFKEFNLSSVPQFESDQVEMLWYDVWYDGPLNGIISYKGNNYYFHIFEPDNDKLGYVQKSSSSKDN